MQRRTENELKKKESGRKGSWPI